MQDSVSASSSPLQPHGLRRRSPVVVLLLVVIAFLAAAAAEVAIGPIMIGPVKVVSQTLAYLHGSRSSDAVVMGAIRWPRMFGAAFVGAGLASTGAALQAVFRNPMADPGLIGVSSGGSLGAVIVIQLGLAAANQWWTPLGAFASGLLTVLLIYRIATVSGRTAIYSLLLAGVAVSSFCSAMVSLLMSLAPLNTMQEMLFWLMGGLDGVTWMSVLMVGTFAVIGFVVYGRYARALDILSIGEEQAEGVGVHLQRVKQVMFITAAFVVGACVSVSGVIAFVGLIVPHLMRIFIGPSHRWLLPASALGGAVLVLVSDLVARMAFLPIELNVGIITASLGAPFFLYLLRRRDTSMRRR
ncbi:FecCD family ABC transporter permease [Alicyclobacillus cycloheptanicus]|uniref:Iron complex transport system permease protein n=1 Tax=Alicyclobacillus cycloheptanicus TaxID=1457 RepID=A0ABT9XF80_9BACL|nr:iron ABC transporter permease [Alicyclobacillus cycloheptanicus]MDQ0188946.1 iron complex transport system permease protein [Alicyclobacillus cycloheptanicus]